MSENEKMELAITIQRTCEECESIEYPPELAWVEDSEYDCVCKHTGEKMKDAWARPVCRDFEISKDYDEPDRKDFYCFDCKERFCGRAIGLRYFDADGFNCPCEFFKKDGE
jgi:hypothetical protein